MTSRSFGLSDVGRRRESNEDEYLVEPTIGLYAVADGMGGHAAGEVASNLAVETLMETVRKTCSDGNTPHDIDAASRCLRDAVHEANRRICAAIEGHEERRGMGTTVVALLEINDTAVIGHVGDSRAYLLRGGSIRRLTSDHSWVNEQVKLGLLSDDAAQRHPMRNIVTRALGSRADVQVDVTREPIRPGDVFLLCSDGLNTMLSDEEICVGLRDHRDDPEAACRVLVEAANERGGEDNTTVVIVAVPGGADGGDTA